MASQFVSDVNDSNFQAEVIDSELPVLVDLWATWCMPCKAIAPYVEAVAEEFHGKLKVVKLDVQANMNTAQKYRVTNIPTLVVFKGGVEVARKVGAGGGKQGIADLVTPHL